KSTKSSCAFCDLHPASCGLISLARISQKISKINLTSQGPNGPEKAAPCGIQALGEVENAQTEAAFLMTECKPEQFQFHRIGNREVVAQFDGGDITTDAGGLLLREVGQRTGIIGKFAACFRSLRPGEQECGFVRERWVPINRLTRRCRPTS